MWHSSKNKNILFVLSHYPEAARFPLVFYTLSPKCLENLTSEEKVAVKSGWVILDIDRKSCSCSVSLNRLNKWWGMVCCIYGGHTTRTPCAIILSDDEKAEIARLIRNHQWAQGGFRD